MKGVLPDADDAPALAAELAGYPLVTRHVVFALFVPELPISFRAGVALGAAVPEASIHEDGDLVFGKCKVGLSEQWKMPSPADNLVLPKQREQRILRLLVAPAADEGHDFGALFSRPDICHESDLVES